MFWVGFRDGLRRSMDEPDEVFWEKLKKTVWVYFVYLFVVFSIAIIYRRPFLGFLFGIPPFGFIYALVIERCERCESVGEEK